MTRLHSYCNGGRFQIVEGFGVLKPRDIGQRKSGVQKEFASAPIMALLGQWYFTVLAGMFSVSAVVIACYQVHEKLV